MEHKIVGSLLYTAYICAPPAEVNARMYIGMHYNCSTRVRASLSLELSSWMIVRLRTFKFNIIAQSERVEE